MVGPSLSTTERACFAPLVFRLAARLEQLTWDEFTADAATLSHALRLARVTFESDALLSWFDTWAEAEHLGLLDERDDDGTARPSGATLAPATLVADALTGDLLPRLADVTRRLAAERDPQTTLMTALTGPATLVQRLWGGETPAGWQDAGRWCVAQTRAHYEAGADVVIVAEADTGAVGAAGATWTRLIEPLTRIASYYGRPCCVLAAEPMPAAVVEWARAGGLTVVGEPARLVVGGGGARSWRLIPNELLVADDTTWEASLDGVASALDRPFCLSSWEVPIDIEPERLAALAGVVQHAGEHLEH